LPVQKSKKGQAKLALFWSKGKESHSRTGFWWGLRGLKPDFAWLQTQDEPTRSWSYHLMPTMIHSVIATARRASQ
jgi:hypothetical protein